MPVILFRVGDKVPNCSDLQKFYEKLTVPSYHMGFVGKLRSQLQIKYENIKSLRNCVTQFTNDSKKGLCINYVTKILTCESFFVT